jgi:hypothetical protein
VEAIVEVLFQPVLVDVLEGGREAVAVMKKSPAR